MVKRLNLPPGTLGYAGVREDRAEIGYSLISYSEKEESHQYCTSLDEAFGRFQKNGVNWLNINGHS